MQNSPLKCTTNEKHEINQNTTNSPDKFASPPTKTHAVLDQKNNSDLKANKSSPSSASPDKIKMRTTQQNEEDFRYQSPPTKQKVYVSPSKHSSSSKKHSNPFGKSVEIIKDKLYWVSDKRPP